MYYIFGGDFYYPGGGGNDLIGFKENLNEAIAEGIDLLTRTGKYKPDWVEVWGTDDVEGLVKEWESNKQAIKKSSESIHTPRKKDSS